MCDAFDDKDLLGAKDGRETRDAKIMRFFIRKFRFLDHGLGLVALPRMRVPTAGLHAEDVLRWPSESLTRRCRHQSRLLRKELG